MNPSLGQIAYEAWFASFIGRDVIDWSTMSDKQKSAWEAAAEAVTAALISGEKMPAGREK